MTDLNEQVAVLALEDGAIFSGRPFGAVETLMAGRGRRGEVVFATGMTGYQEICTDPSYRGQMVCLTYPLIGNYGVAADDVESRRPWLSALLVREYCDEFSNWRATGTLNRFLLDNGIPGVSELDTRALTRHLRTSGTLRGVLRAFPAGTRPDETDLAALVSEARQVASVSQLDVVGDVAIRTEELWPAESLASRPRPDASAPLSRIGLDALLAGEADNPRLLARAGRGSRGRRPSRRGLQPPAGPPDVESAANGKTLSGSRFPVCTSRPLAAERNASPPPPRVLLIDAGYKLNIARCLVQRGLEVVVAPPRLTLADLDRIALDGILLSNGPGDPASIMGLVALTRALIERGDIPLMGICLGHQILGLAAGATTSRLPFGHHGANHPVKELRTGRVTVTSQNHNFQVDAASLPGDSGFYVSHLNLSDGSVEGLAHETLPVFSVQYHPEAAPGPEDNRLLFDHFAALIVAARARKLTRAYESDAKADLALAAG